MARPAPRYTRRVQTLFTPQQYELLREHAREVKKPLSVVVREAVERSLLTKLEQRRKREALKWLCSQELPVDDWEVMERQIETMWEMCG
nr:hypothetical protein [Anaerolineae bacterium]